MTGNLGQDIERCAREAKENQGRRRLCLAAYQSRAIRVGIDLWDERTKSKYPRISNNRRRLLIYRLSKCILISFRLCVSLREGHVSH